MLDSSTSLAPQGLHSNFNARESDTREVVEFVGHNFSPHQHDDMLSGQSSFSKTHRPPYTYQDP